MNSASYQLASLIILFLTGLLFLFSGESAFRNRKLQLFDPATEWGKRMIVEGHAAVVASILLLAIGVFFLLGSIVAFFMLPFFS
ncbi:MAG: hypothetical protein GXP41_12430 [Chloroflexi bacterium]|nr:hypothetical protein [Chloroflexota bacterium]